jgi:Domain of unknown function (DUF4132)
MIQKLLSLLSDQKSVDVALLSFPKTPKLPNLTTSLQFWEHEFPQYQSILRTWLATCISEALKTKPTDKWLHASVAQLDGIPSDQQAILLCNMFDAITNDLKTLHKTPGYHSKSSIPDWCCAVVWYAGFTQGHQTSIRMSLDQLATISYKKFPGVGPLAAKLGNACLRAFSCMPGMEGISALFRFKGKVSNRNVLKLTETLLDEAAQRQQMSRSDLEDLSVPSFELDAAQSRVFQLGDVTARMFLHQQSEVVLEWENSAGKKVKSPPATVKTDHATTLKQVQLCSKELQQVLRAQGNRLEAAYLQQREWNFASFTERYVQHPVLQTLASRLIWKFALGDKQDDAIYRNGQWVDCLDRPLLWLTPNTVVTLWHPLGSDPDRVVLWRDWLLEKGITQPFKQAYREIYIVTPPEIRTLSYSNRFAAHIIRQHQFAALAAQRGWHYTLQGQWDSHNTPYLELPLWNHRIEFWVDPQGYEGPVSDSGVFHYIHTDQVRFYRGLQQVNMPDVPPLLFSELMRDVDLFVGVCSIGNDPNWTDTGNDNRFSNYWRSYAFSEELAESGKMRRAALERIIPRLKIAQLCRFTDKYLVVQGKRHAYKIHCGSGNILMSPNDTYLCIVPDSSAKTSTVFLPFEGDRMLSIIISKALLLAEDDKITDETILRQL